MKRALPTRLAAFTIAIGFSMSLGSPTATAATPAPVAPRDEVIWTTDPGLIDAGMSRSAAIAATTEAAAVVAQPPAAWAGCGVNVDANKVVRTFPQAKVLKCGNANWGYFHIKARHAADWEAKAALTGQNWRDVADIGMYGALNTPEVTTLRSSNDTTCYSKKIYLVRLSDKKTVGTTIARVVAGNRSNNVVTSFPSSGHCTGTE